MESNRKMVLFNVEELREKIDDWMGKGKNRTYVKLTAKCGRSDAWIRQICVRGTAQKGDLHKLCQVINADYDEITTVSSRDMAMMDEYFSTQGKQMAIEDYIKDLDTDEGEEAADDEPERKTEQCTILLRKSTKEWYKQKAWESRKSFNAFVNEVLEDYIKILK